MAFGYYAGNPENLGITVSTALSGVGSVHGRHTPDPALHAAKTKIAGEAVHLFSGPHKGPRADRYMMLTRSERGLQQETRVAKAPVKADMSVTSSLPKAEPRQVTLLAPRKSARENLRHIDHKPEEFGLLPMTPVAERSSASLFLSALTQSSPGNSRELASLGGDDALKSNRGLKFKGESELEYQARQRRCLATAIYFEARGEPERGQVAVAQVVMNRVRSSLYPDTICGVVYQGQHRRTGCQFSFTCDGHADVPKDKQRWLLANELAFKFTQGDTFLGDIGHATHYHANYVSPRWRRELNKIKKVGRHIFYRVRGEQIEDVLKEESPKRGLALSGSG